VLAALPSGAKAGLRLCCRAGRAGVGAHARRLEVRQGHGLLSPAAAARMPLLQELRLRAYDDAEPLALAAGLRALAEGPARLRRATVSLQGGSSAVGGLVSALTGLTALTCLDLHVETEGAPASPPLVLPWANIEVGKSGAHGEGASRGVLRLRMQGDIKAPYSCLCTICDASMITTRPAAVASSRHSLHSPAGPPGCQPAPLTRAHLVFMALPHVRRS
jgi:hypothetical protein